MLEQTLGIPESEALHIVTQIEQCKVNESAEERKKVHFSEEKVFSVQDFLGCFVCQPHVANLEASQHKCITLKSSISSEHKNELGKMHENVSK